MTPKLLEVFLLEDTKNWKPVAGMKLYHVGSSKFSKFNDRPTWFTHDLDQVEGYKKNVNGECWVYTCKLKPVKIATEKDASPFAEKIFGEPVIYSMFDERIGEFDKEDIRNFVKAMEDAGYNGCQHTDYDSVNDQKDSVTLVLFHPNSSVNILDIEDCNK